MLLFADGFDHYGLDEGNMLDGVYATCEQNLSTTYFATGTHSMRINMEAYQFTNDKSLRKVLPLGSETKVGVMMRVYMPTLPATNVKSVAFGFLTPNPLHGHVVGVLDANGCIRFYRDYSFSEYIGFSNARVLIAQTDPILVASAWNHIEVQVYTHATQGWIRVAVNGVHKFEATGLNTSFDAGATAIASVCQTVDRQGGLSLTSEFYMDDYIIYNFDGDSGVDTDFCPTVDGGGVATSYIGELDVVLLPPNGNTAEDDWAKSSGASAFELVDESSTGPNDADYLYSTAAGNLTELELTDLPPEYSYIRGLVLLGRMSKSDSGNAMVQFGMNSDGVTDDADARPITVEPTYWWDFMNIDPDSGARWTRNSLNNAKFRITRSV